VLILGGLSGLLLAACSTTRPHEPAVVVQPAATPRAAIVAAYSALVAGDEAKLLSVCRANAKQQEALSALAKATAAMNEFHKAMVAAYGNEGWEEFNRKKEPAPNGHTSSFQLNFISEKQIVQLEHTPIDLRGGEAFCLAPPLAPEPTPEQKAKDGQAGEKKPDQPTKIRMVKDKHGWLVNAGTLAPGATAKQAELMAGLVRKHQPQIGQLGVTPSQISAQMSGELFAMILSGKFR
jgi:hypothetical protein